MARRSITAIAENAYHTSVHFNKVVAALAKDKSFTLAALSETLHCTTERLRRVRLGDWDLSAQDIILLAEHYHISPMYLLYGVPPMFLGHKTPPQTKSHLKIKQI
jgi:hypothetical protein